MLLQRNKDFTLTSNSLKILYLAVISLKNFKRKLSYNLHENRKFISFSVSSEWQKEQILKFIVVLGIVTYEVASTISLVVSRGHLANHRNIYKINCIR